MEHSQATITCYGGAQTVTGANFLFEYGGKKILLDCGMSQGSKMCEPRNRAPFPYDPKGIDALIVTHSHLDHTGRIPKLVRDGFRGTIYSTPPTKDLAEVMLEDSLGVLLKEAQDEGTGAFYDEADIAHTMRLWKGIPYRTTMDLGGGVTFALRDAGHVLGSAIIELTFDGKRVAYTGDLGNSPSLLLPDTDKLVAVDTVFIESVYGDRNHERPEERTRILEDVIEETMHRGGVLMIPAFSLERTQEALFEIKKMMEHGSIPEVPVFLDSPLAIKVTAIYEKYPEYLKLDALRGEDGGGLFRWNKLTATMETEASKKINNAPAPKIIIAGAGMSNGGRITHHEQRYLPDPKSMLLLLGYQAPGTPGRMMQDGAKEIFLHGETVPIRAQVMSIHGFSAHKDSDHLLEFIRKAGDDLKNVCVVLGEPKSALFLVQRIRDTIGIPAFAPKEGEVVLL